MKMEGPRIALDSEGDAQTHVVAVVSHPVVVEHDVVAAGLHVEGTRDLHALRTVLVERDGHGVVLVATVGVGVVGADQGSAVTLYCRPED